MSLRTAILRATRSAVPRLVQPRFVAPLRCFHASVGRLDRRAVQQTLALEIRLEGEIDEHKEKPEIIDTFLDNSGFKVVDAGESRSLAHILKETDSEKVHVFFDISQVTNIPEPMALEQDAEGNDEYDFEKEMNDEFANVNVVVENKAQGSAILIELLFKLDDTLMYIDSVTPYADAKLALSESAEAESKRQLAYHGPAFSNLDEQLQTAFEGYVKELGVDESLGEFIVAYSEYEENREYFGWLGNLKKFFD